MVVPMVSSALEAVEIRQIPPPMIIGERLNTQGSRKAKTLVLEDNYDGLVDLARMQVEDGAHCLDVCVATTERSDEREFMTKLVKRLSMEIKAPLVIDSTDPDVIESAVRQTPGRPMINSINLEGDGSRFTRLAPIMSKYGLPAVAMCIGPEGMAKTPQQKLETAKLLYNTGKEYGLQPWQFVFDVLTFTLATGENEFVNAGKNTLEGIQLIRENLPGSFTTLGLSNISFGLTPPARRVINSVFLYHAVKAGLDTAIVNAKEIIPYTEIGPTERKLAEGLIYNKSPDALAKLISHFQSATSSGKGGSNTKRVNVDSSWPPGKRANFRIVNRLPEGIQSDVIYAIAQKARMPESVINNGMGDISLDATPEKTHDAAIQTLNEDLLPAMKEVGDKFGAGELILPFVLKSAECMKAAVSELEKHLVNKEGEGVSKGKLVLGTVYGDVHDIGKNLVKTIFQNNGYSVYDLGKQVPLQKFLDKIDEVKPDAIGLSALLVSTSKQMQFFVEYARKNGMDIPVLCGGAAVNSNYINRIAKEGGIYKPGVFYCNTMFEGLKVMDALVTPEMRQGLLEQWHQRLEKWKEKKPSVAVANSMNIPRSNVIPVMPPAVAVQMAGTEPRRLCSAEIPMEEVWPLLDTKSLFKMSWGVRGRAASAESEEEHVMLLEEWKERIVNENLFDPHVVYGYFVCHSKDNTKLDVEYRIEGNNDIVTFDFPRSTAESNLCLADYFGTDDVVAFQSVTVGQKVSQILQKWNADGKYADELYLGGLASQTAEALAEWTNRRIRTEMGLDRGCLRYSWGYGSCPDVAQHRLVWKLLEPQKSGMTLTTAGQIVPEQSTAAIVVHHPEAKYFRT